MVRTRGTGRKSPTPAKRSARGGRKAKPTSAKGTKPAKATRVSSRIRKREEDHDDDKADEKDEDLLDSGEDEDNDEDELENSLRGSDNHEDTAAGGEGQSKGVESIDSSKLDPDVVSKGEERPRKRRLGKAATVKDDWSSKAADSDNDDDSRVSPKNPRKRRASLRSSQGLLDVEVAFKSKRDKEWDKRHLDTTSDDVTYQTKDDDIDIDSRQQGPCGGQGASDEAQSEDVGKKNQMVDAQLGVPESKATDSDVIGQGSHISESGQGPQKRSPLSHTPVRKPRRNSKLQEEVVSHESEVTADDGSAHDDRYETTEDNASSQEEEQNDLTVQSKSAPPSISIEGEDDAERTAEARVDSLVDRNLTSSSAEHERTSYDRSLTNEASAEGARNLIHDGMDHDANPSFENSSVLATKPDKDCICREDEESGNVVGLHSLTALKLAVMSKNLEEVKNDLSVERERAGNHVTPQLPNNTEETTITSNTIQAGAKLLLRPDETAIRASHNVALESSHKTGNSTQIRSKEADALEAMLQLHTPHIPQHVDALESVGDSRTDEKKDVGESTLQSTPSDEPVVEIIEPSTSYNYCPGDPSPRDMRDDPGGEIESPIGATEHSRVAAVGIVVENSGTGLLLSALGQSEEIPPAEIDNGSARISPTSKASIRNSDSTEGIIELRPSEDNVNDPAVYLQQSNHLPSASEQLSPKVAQFHSEGSVIQAPHEVTQTEESEVTNIDDHDHAHREAITSLKDVQDLSKDENESVDVEEGISELPCGIERNIDSSRNRTNDGALTGNEEADNTDSGQAAREMVTQESGPHAFVCSVDSLSSLMSGRKIESVVTSKSAKQASAFSASFQRLQDGQTMLDAMVETSDKQGTTCRDESEEFRSNDDISQTSDRAGANLTKNISSHRLLSRSLNIDRIKVALFAAGRKHHPGRGYERRLADYWAALSLQIERRLTDENSAKCRGIIEGFLKSGKLVKLHNALVLGLMQRCIHPVVRSEDVSQHVPPSWRKRIMRIKPLGSPNRGDSTMRMQILAGRSCSSHPTVEASLQFRDTPTFVEADRRLQDKCTVPAKVSSRIPGAMAIDPYIRSLTLATGMKVSENAIWLFVVAIKEYTECVLKSAISSGKAIAAGQLPPAPFVRLRGLPKKKDRSNDAMTTMSRTVSDEQIQCITAADIHMVTSSVPVGHERSMCGSVSRQTFEKSLFGSSDPFIVPATSDFADVRKFMVEKIALPSITMRSNVQSGRRSPQGGLGKGAKDLAALIARSSVTLKNRQSTGDQTPADSKSTSKTSTQSNVVPNSPSVASPQHEPDACVDSTLGFRRGKGAGVKNLAAMKARSSTSLSSIANLVASPEDTAGSSAAAAALPSSESSPRTGQPATPQDSGSALLVEASESSTAASMIESAVASDPSPAMAQQGPIASLASEDSTESMRTTTPAQPSSPPS